MTLIYFSKFRSTLDNYPIFADTTFDPFDGIDSSQNPFLAMEVTNMPEYLSHQLTRFELELSSSLNCILSKSDSNSDARKANQLINSLTEALGDKLAIWESIRDQIFDQHINALNI